MKRYKVTITIKKTYEVSDDELDAMGIGPKLYAQSELTNALDGYLGLYPQAKFKVEEIEE